MLLPSITPGQAERDIRVPRAVQEQCAHFLLCLLAGSQPGCQLPGGDKHADVMCCSQLGATAMEQMAEPDVPSAVPCCWLGLAAEGTSW